MPRIESMNVPNEHIPIRDKTDVGTRNTPRFEDSTSKNASPVRVSWIYTCSECKYHALDRKDLDQHWLENH